MPKPAVPMSASRAIRAGSNMLDLTAGSRTCREAFATLGNL